MKALSALFVVACALISISATGAIITVNNAGGAQYTNLQTAMDDAASGDTLLVTGEFTSTYYIDKPLHLYGSGFGNSQGYGLPRAYVNNFRFRSVLSGLFPNGSTIAGFELEYVYHITTNFLLQDVVIERNEINVDVDLRYPIENIMIRNNVCQRHIELHNNVNNALVDVNIENNFIEGNIYTYDRDGSGLTIRNNVFADDLQETVLINLISATVNNNIFWRQSPGTVSASHCDGCSFNHNIVYYVNADVSAVYTGNPISGIYGTNVGANNILFNDPLDLDNPIFVNYPSPGGANWTSSHDYHLDDSSPNGVQGVGAGTDGTNIGVYGGNFVMPDRILARIPHVTGVTSLQTSVPAGGTFQIQFGAVKQE